MKIQCQCRDLTSVGVRVANRSGEGVPDPATKGLGGRRDDRIQRMEKTPHSQSEKASRGRGGKTSLETQGEAEGWDLISMAMVVGCGVFVKDRRDRSRAEFQKSQWALSLSMHAALNIIEKGASF